MDFLACSTALRMASGTSWALPRPAPTLPGAVTYHHNGAEAKAAPALDHLGDPIDAHHLIG